ncbi:MAG: hypothetical protein A2653_03045 [Candidatus Zambryskibacteria bacterium RIFCSPHIGHO2_01_FULL_43_25]|uniref:Uncharacterized protein n=1 Tax=Candidatus Zambryskibacteria bacterium RIFCSPLOWO2_01_FULL_45_21 TaxID=1802761 RepID=A0A1G2U2H2_9BACT|nr:MAG: hypothetical protein A2653_03045 [Candidatus Zambryskibacteria bacterium RIFCSPHIGHO2_01_FULL_43_25]OHB00998.1 MAG: hypothetical protein A3E94_02300 [Candidatus Zambryskibacteria bacterium RIFCSPHIGHO2_12_FULL_44_12b]OHB03716.1 MAG: hypothetical protein A3B14_01575 [Candidatus Zambryskibacteria bacterium RIFCSPLOWO2_01_FULL_45_21]
MFVILYLLVSIPVIVFDGFVLSKLWGWFVVTQFDLPSLGVAQAVGISLIVSLLTYQIKNKSDEDSKPRAVRSVIESAAVAFTALVYGWVVSQFV